MNKTETGIVVIVTRSQFLDQLFAMSIAKNDKFPNDFYLLYFSYIFDLIRRKVDPDKDKLALPFVIQFNYLKVRFSELPYDYNLVGLKTHNDTFILQFDKSKPAVPDLSVVESFDVLSSVLEVIDNPDLGIIRKAGCYLLSVDQNEKFYVGESRWLARRIGEHKSDLLKGEHRCRELQDDFNQSDKKEYGLRTILMRVENKYAAEKLEIDLIRFFNRTSEIYNYRLPDEVTEPDAIIRARNGKITLSPETLRKMSETRSGRVLSPEHVKNAANAKKKPIMADGKWFESATECARITGLIQSTVTRRLSNDKFPNWYYIGGKGDPDIEPGTEFVKKRNLNGRTGRRVSVNGVIYLNCAEAAEKTNVGIKTVGRRCAFSPIDYPQWKDWFFVDTDE